MRIAVKLMIRKIADEIVAVPVGASATGFSGILGLNEVGQFLIEMLAVEQTEDTLVSALLEAYDVDQETARADVREVLEHLRNAGLLSEA